MKLKLVSYSPIDFIHCITYDAHGGFHDFHIVDSTICIVGRSTTKKTLSLHSSANDPENCAASFFCFSASNLLTLQN